MLNVSDIILTATLPFFFLQLCCEDFKQFHFQQAAFTKNVTPPTSYKSLSFASQMGLHNEFYKGILWFKDTLKKRIFV